MIPLKKALNSSIGKKYIMGITGLSLVGFMFSHLYGNLFLYWPESTGFNGYTDALHSWGGWLTAAEFGLAALFIIHAAMAFWLQTDKTRAKGRYAESRKTKGGPSHMTIFSRNMFWTGFVLFGFLIVHVLQFRFGPGVEAGYTTTIGQNAEARDLFRLVVETFQDPVWVVIYMVVMLFLGLHVRHGFWSALQSLGAMKPEWSKAIYAVGAAIALIFVLGFMLIPPWLYFDGGQYLGYGRL